MPRWVVEAQLCSVFLPALTGDCRAETAPCSPPGPRVRPWCCGGAPGLLVVLSLQGLRVGVRGGGGALVLRKCIVMVCRRFLVGSLFGWGGIFYFCPPSPPPPPNLLKLPTPTSGRKVSFQGCARMGANTALPHALVGSIPHGNNPTHSGPAHPLT